MKIARFLSSRRLRERARRWIQGARIYRGWGRQIGYSNLEIAIEVAFATLWGKI